MRKSSSSRAVRKKGPPFLFHRRVDSSFFPATIIPGYCSLKNIGLEIKVKSILTFAFWAVIILAMPGCAMLTDGIYDARTPQPTATELYNQALEKYQGRNYADARPLFQQYIGQHQDTPLYKVALYYLAHCDQMLGDAKEAEMLYSRLVDTYGDDDFWGAQAMQRIKQIKEAQ